MNKSYVIYDARASYNVDEASILSVEDTLQEARDLIEEMGWDACIFEYEDNKSHLTNGKLIEE